MEHKELLVLLVFRDQLDQQDLKVTQEKMVQRVPKEVLERMDHQDLGEKEDQMAFLDQLVARDYKVDLVSREMEESLDQEEIEDQVDQLVHQELKAHPDHLDNLELAEDVEQEDHWGPKALMVKMEAMDWLDLQECKEELEE